jgi:prepilin-type N-terminal cleavage/methylation domain-containing protein
MSKRVEDGFTIIELLIATTVFSVVLVGALAGFLEIGKLFYKGVSTTSTQSIANEVLQDVSGQFQSAASFTKVLPQGDVDTVAGNTEVLPTTDQSSHGVR